MAGGAPSAPAEDVAEEDAMGVVVVGREGWIFGFGDRDQIDRDRGLWPIGIRKIEIGVLGFWFWRSTSAAARGKKIGSDYHVSDRRSDDPLGSRVRVYIGGNIPHRGLTGDVCGSVYYTVSTYV